MTDTSLQSSSARATLLLALALAVLAGLPSSVTSATSAAEPSALDAKIVAMMKTNTVGIVEARIHFVEQWAITPIQKSQVFLAMLSSAEADDQRKLAHAALPNIGATNYGLARPHLLNPKLPKTVLSVFMTDALKRAYTVKLPVLLSLAQTTGHPLRNEAQELLRNYLGHNHGTNWVKWEETMLAWLKFNPR